MNTERRILQEFIEIYHSETSLWKTKSNHYNNKGIKAAAYHRLQMKLQELYPDADLDMVKKKINALRTNFRKEQRKVEASRERSPRTGEPIYVPSLWYYNLFHFIADMETSDKSSEEVDGSIDVQNMLAVDLDENVGYYDGEESDENFDEDFQASSPESQKMMDNSNSIPAIRMPANYRSQMMMNNEQQGYKRKREQPSYNNSMMNSWYQPRQEQAQSYVRTGTPPISDTEIFGRYVASKLKKMDKPMQMLSERLISEILFQGEMGCLNRDTRISKGEKTPNKEEPTSS